MGATRPRLSYHPLSASTPSLQFSPTMDPIMSTHSTPSPVRAFYLQRNASSSTSTLGFRGSLPTLARSDSREALFGPESPFASPYVSRSVVESPTSSRSSGFFAVGDQMEQESDGDVSD